jgi:hypothetical protein
MKRDAASTIFRTVVFAGAMLGSGACSKKPASTTPKNTTTDPAPAGDAKMEGDAVKPDTAKTDPCAGGEDPCRPRGTDEDGGGGTGRGFILS